MSPSIRKKLGMSFLVLLTAYCIGLAFVAPNFIKDIALNEANKALNGSLYIDDLSINPLTLNIGLDGIALSKVNEEKLLSLDSLDLNVDLLPLIFKEVYLPEISLSGLVLYQALPETSIPSYDEDNDGNYPANFYQLQNLDIKDLRVDIDTSSINVNDLNISSGEIFINLFSMKANNIEPLLSNLKSLAPEEEENSEEGMTQNEENDEEESETWLIYLDHVSINNHSLHVTNDIFTKRLEHAVNDISIDLINIASDLSQEVTFNTSFSLLAGNTNIKGQLDPESLKGNIDYELKSLALNNLQNILDVLSYLKVDEGILNSFGSINTQKQEEDLTYLLSNETSITGLQLGHAEIEGALLNCPLIESKGFNLDSLQSLLKLKELLINECQINAKTLASGQSNFSLAKEPEFNTSIDQNRPSSESDESSKTKPDQNNAGQNEKPLAIEIETINLENSIINFEDLSKPEAFKISLEDLNGKINNIRQGESDATSFQLTANLNGHAPLDIKGTGNFVNPKPSLDSTVNLQDLGLSSFSAFTLMLSKRPIEKGALSLDLSYKIDKAIISGKNLISIDQLKLGKKQDIKSEHNLPLPLAVAVLRDRKGKIDLDVDVNGNMDDPSFSIVGLLADTFRNIITKAATAPLKVLGGIGKDVDHDFKKLGFELGQFVLKKEHDKKLEALAKALKERPELSVRLTGRSHELLEKPLYAELAELRNKRSAAVKDRLIELGVNPQQISQADSSIDSEQGAEISKIEENSVELEIVAP